MNRGSVIISDRHRIEFEARRGALIQFFKLDGWGGAWQKLADVPAPPPNDLAAVITEQLFRNGGDGFTAVTPALP